MYAPCTLKTTDVVAIRQPLGRFTAGLGSGPPDCMGAWRYPLATKSAGCLVGAISAKGHETGTMLRRTDPPVSIEAQMAADMHGMESTFLWSGSRRHFSELASRRIYSHVPAKGPERTFEMSSLATTPTTTTWNIDPVHTAAEFKVKHMMISHVKGHFSKVTGVLVYDELDPKKSRVEAEIDANSLETREPQRNAHLKSPDFLHVDKFPTLSFKSSNVKVVGAGELEVEGDLTIHGVTRKVTFAVEGPAPPTKDPWGNTRIGLSAKTKINRKDFDLTWNAVLEAGGILVGDEVNITLDVELVRV